MKIIKQITLSVDGEIIRSHRILVPDNGDPLDAECPNCLAHAWTLGYEIVQYGYLEDGVIDILTCKACGHTYHVQYKNEAIYAQMMEGQREPYTYTEDEDYS